MSTFYIHGEHTVGSMHHPLPTSFEHNTNDKRHLRTQSDGGTSRIGVYILFMDQNFLRLQLFLYICILFLGNSIVHYGTHQAINITQTQTDGAKCITSKKETTNGYREVCAQQGETNLYYNG